MEKIKWLEALTLAFLLLAPTFQYAFAATSINNTQTMFIMVPMPDGTTLTVPVTEHVTYRDGEAYVKLEAVFRYGIYEIKINTTEFPLEALTFTPLSQLSIPSEYTYWWDGVLFVKAPGPPNLYIKYDHPDNYYTYDIPVNVDGYIIGNSKKHCHVAQSRIEDWKSNNNVGTVAGALADLIAAALAVPKAGWIAAGVAGVIVAILTLINAAFNYFLSNILQTERGDGWYWVWGYGEFWILKWFWISVGKLRDIGFFIISIKLGGGGGGFCHLL